MPRPTPIALTEAEKRDLVTLIQQGHALPEKYRFVLFEDKREVELVWNGKTRVVCTTVLPFQTLEHVDEPRKEAAASPQGELFDPRGRQVKGWTNKLIWGDNKLILSSLKAGPLRRQIEDAGGLKLIYIDPPFDVGADFSIDIDQRGDQCTWNPQFNEQSEEDVETRYRFSDADGRRFRLGPIDSPNPRPNMMYEWKGFQPPKKGWRYSRERMAELDGQGRIWYPESKEKRPATKLYLDESQGALVGTVWTEFSAVQASAKERLDYPTQKPEALLERIIKASSNEGDLVADFFIGSGTTAAVAEKLGRKWLASDLGKFGIHTTRKRLIGVQRQLQAEGKPFRAFEVLNLGRYERQAYLNVGGRLTGSQKEEALAQKEREFRELILRAYKAQSLAEPGFFHGGANGRLVVVGPINLPVGRLFVEEIIVECRKRGASRVDLLAFEFEMGLFPAVLEEARAKGIELLPKYIPADVFDKRAVERGQVVFHDISFIEATPRYDRKKKLDVSIELTDFSVHYTQGAMDAAIAAMKDGKSQVLCDAGQL